MNRWDISGRSLRGLETRERPLGAAILTPFQELIMTTYEPNVFIVESLRFEDEAAERLEGKFISHILKLNEKKSRYYYIRTVAELQVVIDKFQDSKFRYLHLSCHGNEASMATTLESIPFEKLGKILRPCLDGKRVFLSSCKMANQELAASLIPHSGCYSVIGPSNSVSFSDAAIMWASFYHLIFRLNETAIKRPGLLTTLRGINSLFGAPLNYFSASKSAQTGFKLTKIP